MAGAVYSPRIEYRYSVGGRTYTGNRLSLGDAWRWTYRAENPRDFRLIVATLAPGVEFRKFLEAPQCQDIPAYDSCSVSFELDQPLGVRVDPRDPQNSAVEVGELAPVTLLNHLLPPVAWIVCALLAAWASAASALTMLRRLLAPDAEDTTPELRLPLRYWGIAGGLLAANLGIESWVLILDWRPAPEGFAELLGWVPGIALCAACGLLSVYLVFQPAIDRKFRRRRRHRN